MKLQKNISIIAGSISVIALSVSIIFNCCCDGEYISNLFMGVFSSAILVCATSIATYFYERNKTIYMLYEGCTTFKQTFTKVIRTGNRIDFNLLKDIFSIVIESYKKDIYYQVCALNDSMIKNTKLNKLVLNIWEQSRHLYLLVVDDNEKLHSYLLNNISLEELHRYEFHFVSSESVEYMKRLNDAQEELAYHMNYYNLRNRREQDETE